MLRKLTKNVLPYGIVRWRQRRAERAFHAAFSEKAQKLADGRFLYSWEDAWPCLHDANAITKFEPHYLYHTAWACRILAETRPAKHVDIGSCLRFVSMASAFVPINFFDYRPANIFLSGLVCEGGDLMGLPFPDTSIHSISCMHVVEHIGLERYGDPFDPQGDLKAVAELTRVLSKDGQLLFVVPVGEVARLQYNAHRIYTHTQIIEYFSTLQLRSFALVLDSGEFVEQATPEKLVGQKHACGCYHFINGVPS